MNGLDTLLKTLPRGPAAFKKLGRLPKELHYCKVLVKSMRTARALRPYDLWGDAERRADYILQKLAALLQRLPELYAASPEGHAEALIQKVITLGNEYCDMTTKEDAGGRMSPKIHYNMLKHRQDLDTRISAIYEECFVVRRKGDRDDRL